MFEFGCQRSLAFAVKAARQGRETGEQSKSAIDSTPVHIPFWFIAGIKRPRNEPDFPRRLICLTISVLKPNQQLFPAPRDRPMRSPRRNLPTWLHRNVPRTPSGTPTEAARTQDGERPTAAPRETSETLPLVPMRPPVNAVPFSELSVSGRLP